MFAADQAANPDDKLPEITLQDGRFAPLELAVPANTAFKLRVTNAGRGAIEFESFELHRERVVQPGETITVYMPALAPGTYKFFDDFHRDTPEGVDRRQVGRMRRLAKCRRSSAGRARRCGAIRAAPAPRIPPVAQRPRRAGRGQERPAPRLLRLPFQRDDVAVVQRRRPALVGRFVTT